MQETLRTIFAARYREWTTQEALKSHIAAGVPVSEVNRWWQLFDHPQFREQGFFVRVEHPAVGETEILGCPMTLTETPSSIRSPAPTLGQHTEEVLTGLGYSPAQVEELRRQRVIM
jgi:formyl-CoA transferase/CoA:oxalate CoA-transferase